MMIPTMLERPEKRAILCTAAYWLLAFFMVPILLLYTCADYYSNSAVLGWVQIGYYIINAVCTVFIFREHIAETWFYVRMEFKKFALTIMMCLGITHILFTLIYGIYTLMFIGGMVSQNPGGMGAYFTAFPVSELELFMLPASLVRENPLVSIPVLALATPITVSGLLYGAGFAPACEKNVWLGYAVGIGVLILHRNLNYCTVSTMERETVMFLLQLPIHLGGFIAYHRTNSIWAPMIFLAINNLLACLGLLLFVAV